MDKLSKVCLIFNKCRKTCYVKIKEGKSMRKLNINLKKNAVISVLLILAFILGIGLIIYVTKERLPEGSQVALDKNAMNKVNVDEIKADTEVNVKEPIIVSTENTEKTVKENVVISKEEVPKAEEAKKPEPPKEKPKTQDDITDKSKVPTYTEKAVNPSTEATPKAGEKNSSGQIYVPGFGWVKDSGPNKTVKVDSSGDINKQVGKMD
jgi:outer membrane biosynthesis protein TonB